MRTNWGCIGLVSPDVGLLLELMDAVRMGQEKKTIRTSIRTSDMCSA